MVGLNRPIRNGCLNHWLHKGAIMDEQITSNRLLTLNQVQPQVQLSRVTIWRWEKEGKFPKHIKLGRSIRWRESDIQAWINGLQAA